MVIVSIRRLSYPLLWHLLAILCFSQQVQPDVTGRLNADGLRLMKQGKFKEAIEKFRKAAQADPKDVEALNNLGVALRRQGEFSNAVDRSGESHRDLGAVLRKQDKTAE